MDPTANEVTVDVLARDKSAPGFQSVKKNADAAGASVKRMGEIAGGILTAQVFQRIGAAAVRGFTDTIRAASALEQAVGGTRAVFGDSSAAIDAWADDSAQAAGLSEREFREMTTLVGGQLKRMTGDLDFASEGSIRLTQTAADLAATYGGTTKQAMDAFAAALRGEADPAERFNLNLKQSVVAAKAVELGLAESTSKVSEQAKAQAMLALITEQSADAQGQFAEEADTAAVAHQKMTAEVENAQAAIGQALLPALASAAGVVSSFAGFVSDVPAPVTASAIAIGVLSVAMLVLVPKLQAAHAALAQMSPAAASFASKAGSAAAAIAALAAIVAVGTQASDEYSAGINEATASLERLRAGKADEFIDRFVKSGEDAKITWRDLFDTTSPIEHANEFAAGLESLDAALATMVAGGDAEAAEESLAALADRMGLTKEETAELVEQLPQYRDALAGARAEEEGAAAGAEQMAAQMQSVAAAVDAAAASLEGYSDAQRRATDPVFAMIDALDSVDKAQTGYNEAVEEFGAESPEASSAAMGLAKAVQTAELAAIDGDLSFDAFRSRLAQWVSQGVITAAQAKTIEARVAAARGAAEDYAGTYNANVVAIDNATQRLKEIRAWLDSIRSKTVTITARTQIPQGVSVRQLMELETGGIVGAMGAGNHAAEGGPRGGNSVLVGEGGPEIAELPYGTRVIPAGQTQATLANQGSGGITINLTAGIIGSQPELDDWLVKAVDRLQRRGRLGVA